MQWLLNLTSGYKTYIAGLSAILTGASQMLGVAPDAISQTTPHGVSLIIIGLGLLGIGHKVDKLLAVLKFLTEVRNVRATTPSSPTEKQ